MRAVSPILCPICGEPTRAGRLCKRCVWAAVRAGRRADRRLPHWRSLVEGVAEDLAAGREPDREAVADLEDVLTAPVLALFVELAAG